MTRMKNDMTDAQKSGLIMILMFWVFMLLLSACASQETAFVLDPHSPVGLERDQYVKDSLDL